jgi:hypothetical protein
MLLISGGKEGINSVDLYEAEVLALLLVSHEAAILCSL